MDKIQTHIIDLDPKIEEQIVLNNDGSYSIFINARLNRERQLAAYRHALSHILKRDFRKSDADDIEMSMRMRAVI